jgi:predicted dehydrogenase
VAAHTDSVRIGIVGLGRWTKNVHIPTLALIPQARVTALCARRQESLDEGAALLEGPVAKFQDYHALVGSDQVDAVVVSTPNNVHEPVSAAALEAGKHVFVEKPMAFAAEGCARLRSLAKRKGLVLQVGYELPYAPPFARGLEMIRQGAIGVPSIVICNVIRDFVVTRGWRGDKEQSGGVLLEMASHYINLADALADATPLAVEGFGGGRLLDDVDYGWCLIRYDNQIVGSVCSCMFGSGHMDIAATAIGTEGRLDMSVDTRTIVLHRRDDSDPQVTSIPQGVSAAEHGHWGTYEEMVDFISCVREGRRPRVDGIAGSRAVVIALAFEQSVRQMGQPVPLLPIT